MTHVLITGARGQLGHQLLRDAPADVKITAVDREEMDLSQAKEVRTFVENLAPDVIFHGGAYTAVDKAESERELALAVNAEGARALAESAREVGARVFYISTDYVFGHGHDRPIPIDAIRAPLNVYGESKARGEDAILEILPERGTVVRTSWVYGPVGSNFFLTMRRLIAERDVLRVVADQIAVPTSTSTLSRWLWSSAQAQQPIETIAHVTDLGVASWYDFAVGIREELKRLRPSISRLADIRPIPSEAYPTAAERPRFSRLKSSTSESALHWRAQCAAVASELEASSGTWDGVDR